MAAVTQLAFFGTQLAETHGHGTGRAMQDAGDVPQGDGLHIEFAQALHVAGGPTGAAAHSAPPLGIFFQNFR